MSDWHHPQHYTHSAKAFAEAERGLLVENFADKVLPSLRRTATSVGYTLALHGSLVRDLDLIAVPWRKDACDPDRLITMLCAEIKMATGWGHQPGKQSAKPHGRIAVTILGTSDVHVDLSIMPRLAPEAPADGTNQPAQAGDAAQVSPPIRDEPIPPPTTGEGR